MTEVVSALISLLLSVASPQATIVFAGDAMQHKAQLDAARTQNGIYDYSDCFSEISSYISQADYAVVNLETPLGGSPYTGYPCFSAPDQFLIALKDAGFDMFLTANNHTLDRRSKGLKRTVEVLDKISVDHIGTYPNITYRDSLLPLIRDINGFSVGFLNYTYGTNGIPATDSVVVDFINRDVIKTDVDKLLAKGAELIVASIHWGVEYVMLPNKEQISLADYLTEDLGVDVVIGCHPHVVQPMEFKWNKKHSKNTFVTYSLGNFISNMKTRDTRGGALAEIVLSRDSVGKAIVKEAKYSLVFTEPPSKSHKNFKLVKADQPISEQWRYHCNEFEKSAQVLFDKHNISVPRNFF